MPTFATPAEPLFFQGDLYQDETSLCAVDEATPRRGSGFEQISLRSRSLGGDAKSRPAQIEGRRAQHRIIFSAVNDKKIGVVGFA